MRQTTEHNYFAPGKVAQLSKKVVMDSISEEYDFERDLRELHGIDIPSVVVEDMMVEQAKFKRSNPHAFDSLPSTLTTGSVGTPIQFRQNWLPGFVNIVTAPRKADELMGMSISGSWEDEQIVQGEMELTGAAIVYGDLTNTPYNNWNTNFITRNVVRFEGGMRVGVLGEAAAARMRVNDADSKRKSAALSLEISRNYVGFYGYSDPTTSLTYGFLNDPGLPSYVASPNGSWAAATFLQIQQAILTYIQAVQTNSNGVIDPLNTPMILALANSVVNYMAVTSDFGISVMEWMNKAYPKIRVVAAPQLDAAHSSENVAYLYAESVMDADSTDDGRVWAQVVPAKFRLNGVQKLAKGYEESYANATSGALCKRPYAVVRFFGI